LATISFGSSRRSTCKATPTASTSTAAAASGPAQRYLPARGRAAARGEDALVEVARRLLAAEAAVALADFRIALFSHLSPHP
jgi:hypothetical protein